MPSEIFTAPASPLAVSHLAAAASSLSDSTYSSDNFTPLPLRYCDEKRSRRSPFVRHLNYNAFGRPAKELSRYLDIFKDYSIRLDI